MSREIKGKTGTGKTHLALSRLAENGGGILITRYLSQTMGIAKQMGLSDSNIKVVELPAGTTIMIDDADEFDVWEVRQERKGE